MDLFRRSKETSSQRSISDAGDKKPIAVKVKEIDELQLEATRNELVYTKKELQETMTRLDSASQKLERIREEHEMVSKELESKKSGPPLVKSQYNQKEIEFINEKIKITPSELHELESKKIASSELASLNSQVESAKSELSAIQSQYEKKKNEIMLAKRELGFIEKELLSLSQRQIPLVSENNDTKKIVEAAGAVVASANAKYEASQRELGVVKTTLAKVKEEYEASKNELTDLKNRIESDYRKNVAT